jgi:hypothetical protein
MSVRNYKIGKIIIIINQDMGWVRLELLLQRKDRGKKNSWGVVLYIERLRLFMDMVYKRNWLRSAADFDKGRMSACTSWFT